MRLHDSPRTTPRARRVLAAAVAVTLALGAVGCGDDDDDAATDDSTTSEAATSEPTDEPTDDGAEAVDALCTANIDIDKAFALGPEADEAALTAAATTARDLLSGIEGLPDEPAGIVGDLLPSVEAAADGDPSALETPEFNASVAELGQWVVAECGFENIAITATDYHFDGIPDTVPAGPTAFQLTNDGEEPHVLVVSRKKDGVEASFDELLADPDLDPTTVVDDVASGAFAVPGESGVVTADLIPGEYVVICPIPIGTPTDGPPPADSPPHFTAGMVHTFVVE